MGRYTSTTTSSYVESEYTPPPFPQYPGTPSYYPEDPYASNSSTAPSAPAYPDYRTESYPPAYPPSPQPHDTNPNYNSSFYPKIQSQAPSTPAYPPVAAWPGASSAQDPASGYSQYVPGYGSYAAPPQAPPGLSFGYGRFESPAPAPVPYNQVADPTYNLNPPGSLSTYGSSEPEPYPPASVAAPPSLQGLSLSDGGHGRVELPGRFRAHSMPGT